MDSALSALSNQTMSLTGLEIGCKLRAQDPAVSIDSARRKNRARRLFARVGVESSIHAYPGFQGVSQQELYEGGRSLVDIGRNTRRHSDGRPCIHAGTKHLLRDLFAFLRDLRKW